MDADAGYVEVHRPRENRTGGDEEDAESDTHVRVAPFGVSRRKTPVPLSRIRPYSFTSYAGATSITSKNPPPIPPSDGTLSGGCAEVIVLAVTL